MQTLSVFDTFLATLPLLLAIGIFQWKLQRCADIAVAAARMVLQLVATGFVLSFLFEHSWPWMGLAIVLFMAIISATIAVRPLRNKSGYQFRAATLALLCSAGIHLIWITQVVLRLAPWYQPQFVIPIAGMLFANGMNSLSLGAERLEAELERNAENAATTAFNAAMIPQINALLAVGLVSLPGMMTGQILSGVAPLEAIRYQIMVMSMIAGTSSVALLIYFYLQRRFTVVE